MEIIDSQSVKVFTSQDLKEALENDNGYLNIYLANDITLESGITLNSNKEKIIIDGTKDNKYTLTGMNSVEVADTIVATSSNKEIVVRNMNISYTNTYGVVYVPLDTNYAGILTTYDSTNFKGTRLAYNPYGKVKIVDSYIVIEETNGVASLEVCMGNYVIIGGKTTVTSSSTNGSLFYFRNNLSPSIVFLCQSDVSLSTDTKEFMTGTNRLNFTILHDTKVNIVTANGFISNPVYGTNNVLIDERATLVLIQKSHQRVPMWSVFGNFVMKKGSNLEIINSYENTPADNYNLHFKGSSCKLILDNPNSVILYSKNANIFYANNQVEYQIKCKKINLWSSSKTLTSAGDINDLPLYSWYKDDDLIEINGTFDSTTTSITSHNLTEEELTNLPELSNFLFQSKKQLSIGDAVINVHPINASKNKISGHTTSMADVLIKYNDVFQIVAADSDGLFEYSITDIITDGTEIEIISNVSSSFIYGTRKITSPFEGELSIINATKVFTFSLVPLATSPTIFPKTNDLTINVVDSRTTSSNWKIYAYIKTPPTSQAGYVLNDALIFKNFEDENIVLDENPKVVFNGVDSGGVVENNIINWSKEKGPLLDLTNEFLEANEEYFVEIYFILEE